MKGLKKIIFALLKNNARNILLIALIILNCILLIHIRTMSNKIVELRDVIEKIDCKEEDEINDDFDYFYKEKDSRKIKEK